RAALPAPVARVPRASEGRGVGAGGAAQHGRVDVPPRARPAGARRRAAREREPGDGLGQGARDRAGAAPQGGVRVMSIDLKVPSLGESVREATLERWLKKEGDFVKRDEPVVALESDKANVEVPAPV